jgi:hypothetical protein
MLRGIISAALLATAHGHGCDSGGVECMAVLTTKGGVSMSGRMYDAQGSALCTPEGRVLYCLVDHSYHGPKCSDGEVPCCADGSFPRHESYDNAAASSDVPDCEAVRSQEHSGQDRRGVLLLKIQSEAADIMATLSSDDAQAVLMAALSAFSGAEAVVIQTMAEITSSARRLSESAETKIDFIAHGHEWTESSDSDLATALQRGFDEKGLDLKINSAKIEWMHQSPIGTLPSLLLAIGGAVILVVLGGGAWLLMKRQERKAQLQMTSENADAEPGKVGASHDADVESASTGTGDTRDDASLTASESPSTQKPVTPPQEEAI